LAYVYFKEKKRARPYTLSIKISEETSKISRFEIPLFTLMWGKGGKRIPHTLMSDFADFKKVEKGHYFLGIYVPQQILFVKRASEFCQKLY